MDHRPTRRTRRTRSLDEFEVLTPAHQQRLLAAVRAGEAAQAALASTASPVERRALEADVRTGQRAMQRLVCCNMRLVVWCVRRYTGHHPWLTWEDRVQEGVRGLVRAIEKYDPGMGTKFSTYAVWWVRQAIGRAVHNAGLVRIPVYVQEGRGSAESRAWEERFDDLVSIEALLAGWYAHEAAVMNDLDDDVLGDIGIGEPVDSDDTGHQVEAALLAEQALAGLSEREAMILRRRAGFDGAPETLEEIGRDLRLTRERVRQIESKALDKVRQRLHLAA